MDLSKLPKLSGDQADAKPALNPSIDPADPSAPATAALPSSTVPQAAPPPTPASAQAAPPVVAYAVVSPGSLAANAWVSLIVGLVLLYLGRNFAAFAIATLTGKPFHTGVEWTAGPQTGEVPYFQLQGYTAWTDTAVFLFGVVMLLDGLVWALAALRTGRIRLVLLPATVLTGIGVLFNAVVAVILLTSGTVPLISFVAVAIGGWIFFDQWRMLRTSTVPLAQAMR